MATRSARTPVLDALATGGVVFDRAYAASPVTLPSHATLLTGRYPPGHGSRDNGLRVSADVPTLATELAGARLQDRGVCRGVPARPSVRPESRLRGLRRSISRAAPDGRIANERPASQVVGRSNRVAADPYPPHLPHLPTAHLPYVLSVGPPLRAARAVRRSVHRPARARPVRRRDRDRRPRDRPAPRRAWAGATRHADCGRRRPRRSVRRARRVCAQHLRLRHHAARAADDQRSGIAGAACACRMRVTLADVAPTRHAAARRSAGRCGRHRSFAGIRRRRTAAARAVRGVVRAARRVRVGAAAIDPVGPVEAHRRAEARAVRHREGSRRADQRRGVAAYGRARLEARADRYSRAALPTPRPRTTAEAAERLRALGYSSRVATQQSAIGKRPDPKDRRELAARIAQVTSGELTGAALVAALEGIVREDPRNGQAHLRLGYARLQAGDCARAEPEFHAAAAAGLPSADVFLGLATCLGRRRDLAGAERALGEARRLEPDNPAVIANIGLLQAASGDVPARDSVAAAPRWPPTRTCTRRASTWPSRMRKAGRRGRGRGGRARAAHSSARRTRRSVLRSIACFEPSNKPSRIQLFGLRTRQPRSCHIAHNVLELEQGSSIQEKVSGCCVCRQWSLSSAVLLRTLSSSDIFGGVGMRRQSSLEQPLLCCSPARRRSRSRPRARSPAESSTNRAPRSRRDGHREEPVDGLYAHRSERRGRHLSPVGAAGRHLRRHTRSSRASRRCPRRTSR